MEDEDPELTVNPVLAAKIQMQKDRERKKKKGVGGVGTGRSGGLKRLNLCCGNETKKVLTAPPQQACHVLYAAAFSR